MELSSDEILARSIDELQADLRDQQSLFELLQRQIQTARDRLSPQNLTDEPYFYPDHSIGGEFEVPSLLPAGAATPWDVRRLAERKRRRVAILRELIKEFSHQATRFEWQSPPISGSFVPHQGAALGEIDDNYFFYKRERHHIGRRAERAFLSFILKQVPAQSSAFLFSSGMAAFATILQHLRPAKDRRIAIGAAAYCENRELCQRTLPKEAWFEFEERDFAALRAALRSGTCAALLIDSLPNHYLRDRLDIPALLTLLANECDENFTVVIDDTCGLKTQQIFSFLDSHRPPFQTAVLHSLIKYFQFGFDLANGGLLLTWSENDSFAPVDRLRQLLGTGIADTLCYCHPCGWEVSDAERAVLQGVLTRRMARMSRNSAVLRSMLGGEDFHPGDQPGECEGSLLFCNFAELLPGIEANRALCRTLVDAARAAELGLVYGTSFGFDVTRVCPSRAGEGAGAAGIRIGPGTESLFEIVALAQVIRTTVKEWNTGFRGGG